MESHRIGVFGASGFAGSALCERLVYEGKREFRAYIHSTGNCWRLTRFALPLEVIDICDAGALAAAMRGCSVVVNCTRGDEKTMLEGLRTMLRVARDRHVRKFIHLSSLAIYGDNPAPDSVTEEGRTGGPWLNAYGRLKLAQDELVFKAHKSGLPCYILCPGNIGGPHSELILGLAKRLLSGPFGLVDGGQNPTNIVHIDNLVQAIICAIDSDHGAGHRSFVNDSEPVSWYEFCTALARQIDCEPDFFDVPYEKVLAGIAPKSSPRGIREHLRIALSGEFRNAVSVLPALGWANAVARKSFDRLPRFLQTSIRARAQSTVRVQKRNEVNVGDMYLKFQLRRHYHSPAKLVNELGYRHAVDYERALDSTGKFLRFALCKPETFPALCGSVSAATSHQPTGANK
jgi:nucleoside-diphosphate-sugar epimerase